MNPARQGLDHGGDGEYSVPATATRKGSPVEPASFVAVFIFIWDQLTRWRNEARDDSERAGGELFATSLRCAADFELRFLSAPALALFGVDVHPITKPLPSGSLTSSGFGCNSRMLLRSSAVTTWQIVRQFVALSAIDQESFGRIASIHDRNAKKDPTAIEGDIISQESAAKFELARMCWGVACSTAA